MPAARYVPGTTIVGAPPGAPPSQVLDHDLVAPNWTDTFKWWGVFILGILGFTQGSLTDTRRMAASQAEADGIWKLEEARKLRRMEEGR